MAKNGDEIIKLKAIHDYNQSMGGVDRNDGQIGHYKCVQKHISGPQSFSFILLRRQFSIVSLFTTRLEAAKDFLISN